MFFNENAGIKKSCKSPIFCIFCAEIGDCCDVSAASLKKFIPCIIMQALADYTLNPNHDLNRVFPEGLK